MNLGKLLNTFYCQTRSKWFFGRKLSYLDNDHGRPNAVQGALATSWYLSSLNSRESRSRFSSNREKNSQDNRSWCSRRRLARPGIFHQEAKLLQPPSGILDRNYKTSSLLSEHWKMGTNSPNYLEAPIGTHSMWSTGLNPAPASILLWGKAEEFMFGLAHFWKVLDNFPLHSKEASAACSLQHMEDAIMASPSVQDEAGSDIFTGFTAGKPPSESSHGNGDNLYKGPYLPCTSAADSIQSDQTQSALCCSNDSEVCAVTLESVNAQASEPEHYDETGLSLLRSPFEPIELGISSSVQRDGPVLDDEMALSPMSCGNSSHLSFNSLLATDSVFESPSGQYTELPQLIHNIEVTCIEPAWEKGGGFSIVRKGLYRAENGDQIVAVKHVKHPASFEAAKSRKALQNELKVLSRIPAHPNIVQVIGANFNGSGCEGDMCLVEELLDSNLADILRDPCNPLGLSYCIILRICRDIARGLEHLSRNNIVHFDLKPQNILVDAGLNAKIADFGSAKVRRLSDLAGSIGAGTFGYSPPEISPLFSHFLNNQTSMDKIDVYSLGVILYECVTGKSPADTASFAFSVGSTYSRTRPSGLGNCYNRGFEVPEWCPEVISSLIADCTHFDYYRRISISAALARLEGMVTNTNWENSYPAWQTLSINHGTDCGNLHWKHSKPELGEHI